MKIKFQSLIILAGVFCSVNTIGQTSSKYNVPPKIKTGREIHKGPLVYGIFEGRPPCNAIEKQMGLPVRPECVKVKWRITFFRDPVTNEPTTYELLGALLPPTGKWTLTKGTSSDPNAEVIHMNPDIPGKSFYLLKGDENVLFVLDEKKEFRVGGTYLSYTLNRVELIPEDKK